MGGVFTLLTGRLRANRPSSFTRAATMLWSEMGLSKGLGVHDDVSHELSVSLPREDVVNAFFASPVEGMRYTILGGA